MAPETITNLSPKMEPTAPQKPEKIVILGGGISALTTAFELTSVKDWQKKYEITLYQMGWRLGGQCASGRDVTHQERIKEHGPHIWFGFYENAFNLLWRCYTEMNRSPLMPFPTIESAFLPVNTSVLMEHIDDTWKPWPINFPTNSEFPGIPAHPADPESVSEFPSLWTYMVEIMSILFNRFRHSPLFELAKEPGTPDPSPQPLPTFIERILGTLELEFAAAGLIFEAAMLELAFLMIKRLDPDPDKHEESEHAIIMWALNHTRDWFCKNMDRLSKHSDTARRDLILLDLGLTMIIGFMADDVLDKGLNSLNVYDWREWLIKNGICPMALDSVAVNSVYDLFFGYQNGDTTKPNIEAGSLIRSMMRMVLTYKGSVMYKMRAGMGDIVIAPVYQLLKQRGVKFRFFHRVTELVPEGDQIKEIHLARQVDLKVGEYDPLILVKNLPCWPDRPLYYQLVQGTELEQRHVNLESRWADWTDVGQVKLQAGIDYDRIVLGISLAALTDVCKPIIESNPTWKNMVEKIQTVQTQNVQVWMKPKMDETGWTLPFNLTTYVEPLSSWGDFSQVVPSENFQRSDHAHTVVYGSGVLKDDYTELPPPSDHGFPAKELQRVKDLARQFLTKDSYTLWPKISTPSGEIDWDSLVAPDSVHGPDRLDAQYMRANIDPTERYLLAVSNTDQYRVKTDQSGYKNLWLAGVYIDNGLFMSAVEAAVVSGKMTSRSICGYPEHITGEVKE